MPRLKQTARKSTTTTDRFFDQLLFAHRQQQQAEERREFSPIGPDNLDRHPLNNMAHRQTVSELQSQLESASMPSPQTQPLPQLHSQSQQPASAGSAILSQQVVQPDGSRARSVQRGRPRRNPLAAPRSPSQERDPDWPMPGGGRQSYRRGPVSQPISDARPSRDRSAARQSSSPSPQTAEARQTPSLHVPDLQVIEQLQTAVLNMDHEISMLRIDRSHDREQLIYTRGEITRLNTLVNELKAELANAELIALRDKVHELETMIRNQQPAAQANGADCLGAAVTKLVLSSLRESPANSRNSCHCTNQSCPSTPRIL